jgi:hypothetical protein
LVVITLLEFFFLPLPLKLMQKFHMDINDFRGSWHEQDYDFLGFFHVIFFTMQEMGMVYGVLLKSLTFLKAVAY